MRLLVRTRSPEMSEYFFAGLNDGGASMVLSESYMIAILPSMVLSQTKLHDPSYKQWCYMKHVTWCLMSTVALSETQVFLLPSVVLTNQLMNSMEQSFLDKLTGAQQVKKFPIFYGTWRFITAFTSGHNLSLSWAISFQSMPPIPFLEDPF